LYDNTENNDPISVGTHEACPSRRPATIISRKHINHHLFQFQQHVNQSIRDNRYRIDKLFRDNFLFRRGDASVTLRAVMR